MSSLSLPGIQVLRALAALMVAFHHVQADAAAIAARTGRVFEPSTLLPWMAGVDIFFVVSGFIMVHASQDLFGREGAARTFLGRRLLRIVPLYWAATTLFLAVGLVLSAALNSAAPDLATIVKSYLFWPAVGAEGRIQPVYSLGWTLNYEMLFYALFGAALTLPARAVVPAVAVALGILVAAETLAGPLPLPVGFWGKPIVLEFAGGMAIAVLRRQGLRLDGGLRWSFVAAAVALLMISARFGAEAPAGAASPWTDLLLNGGAAVLLVAAAGCGRGNSAPPALVRGLAHLGDASYALYLVHPFVMRALREVALRILPVSPAVFIPLAVAGAVVAALLVYRGFERPTTRGLRRLLRV